MVAVMVFILGKHARPYPYAYLYHGGANYFWAKKPIKYLPGATFCVTLTMAFGIGELAALLQNSRKQGNAAWNVNSSARIS